MYQKFGKRGFWRGRNLIPDWLKKGITRNKGQARNCRSLICWCSNFTRKVYTLQKLSGLVSFSCLRASRSVLLLRKAVPAPEAELTVWSIRVIELSRLMLLWSDLNIITPSPTAWCHVSCLTCPCSCWWTSGPPWLGRGTRPQARPRPQTLAVTVTQPPPARSAQSDSGNPCWEVSWNTTMLSSLNTGFLHYLDNSSFIGAKDIFGNVPLVLDWPVDVYRSEVLIKLKSSLIIFQET